VDPGHKARKNPSDKADLGFQAIGPAVRIMQLNVEGLSAAKRRIIQSLAEIHHLLKTHRKRRMTRSIAPRGLSATADLVVS